MKYPKKQTHLKLLVQIEKKHNNKIERDFLKLRSFLASLKKPLI